MQRGILICALAWACAAQRPAWTVAAAHPEYDDSRYVRAVGAGQSTDPLQARRAADLSAFAGVAQQIRVLVTSENLSAASEETSGAAHSEQGFVAEVVRSFAQESLLALRVAERYAEPKSGTAWSLAVLDRAVALRELSRLLTETKLSASEARGERDRALREGRIRAAFASLRAEYAAAVRSVELARTASALQRDPEPKRLEALSPAAVLAEARRALEQVQLRKVAGDGQELIPGSAARNPLEIQALYQGTPLRGLQLRATAASGALNVETPPATDESGRSRFGIPLVGRDPADAWAVAVRADLSSLRDGKDPLWDDAFAGEPAVVFSFGRVAHRALRIELRASGELLPALREELAGKGYALVDSDPDVIVEGEARIAPAGSTRIGKSARCSGELRVLRGGAVVGRLPLTASAVGPTLGEALARALRTAARNAAENLPSALR